MKLGFDLDGVLADFHTPYIQRVIAVTGEDRFPPRPFEIPVWDYPQHYGYTNAEVAAVWASIHADPAFWVGLPTYPWTTATLTLLDQWSAAGTHDVYFITSRSGVQAKRQTETWLAVHGLRSPTVLLSGAKDLSCKALGLDLYVDDYRVNADAVHFNSPTRVFLFDQPWNRDGRDFYTRITSVEEMFMRVTPR